MGTPQSRRGRRRACCAGHGSRALARGPGFPCASAGPYTARAAAVNWNRQASDGRRRVRFHSNTAGEGVWARACECQGPAAPAPGRVSTGVPHLAVRSSRWNRTAGLQLRAAGRPPVCDLTARVRACARVCRGEGVRAAATGLMHARCKQLLDFAGIGCLHLLRRRLLFRRGVAAAGAGWVRPDAVCAGSRSRAAAPAGSAMPLVARVLPA